MSVKEQPYLKTVYKILSIYRVAHKEVYKFDFIILAHLRTNYFETYTFSNRIPKKVCENVQLFDVGYTDTKWWCYVYIPPLKVKFLDVVHDCLQFTALIVKQLCDQTLVLELHFLCVVLFSLKTAFNIVK